MIDKIKDKLKKMNDKVVFNEETHQYFIENKEYNSVSSTLEYYSRGIKRIPKHILDDAVKRGNMVHLIAEEMLKGATSLDIDKELLYSLCESQPYWDKEKHMPYINNLIRYWQLLDNDSWEVLAVEQTLFSVPEKVAGQVDLILIRYEFDETEWNNDKNTYKEAYENGTLRKDDYYEIEIKIVDYKTGNIKIGNYAQVSIYHYMLKKALKSLKLPIKITTELISLKDMERVN